MKYNTLYYRFITRHYTAGVSLMPPEAADQAGRRRTVTVTDGHDGPASVPTCRVPVARVMGPGNPSRFRINSEL